MNILMAASEALPFSKTGGLSDVAYSLSKEYAHDHNVMLCLPYYNNKDYSKIKRLVKVYEFDVEIFGNNKKCEVYHCKIEGIDYFLFRNDYYFFRKELYSFYDDGERFAFFQNAILNFVSHLSFNIDVIHVHDWQTAMIPVLLKTNYANNSKFNKIKTVLTIHNPLFKGYFHPDALYGFYKLDYHLFESGKVRLDNQVSTLKAGIVFADKITTVSPTHKDELLYDEIISKGLSYDLSLRRDDFIGILNGINKKFFDPKSDKTIAFNYDKKDFLEGKEKNKVALAKEFNFDSTRPLICFISRLSDQKGLNLLFPMIEQCTRRNAVCFILGSGDKDAENRLKILNANDNKHIAIYIGYNEDLAHKIYASSDLLLMPSAFEPCGLSQMIAQGYGCLPLVRLTGGLKDTVDPISSLDFKKSPLRVHKSGFGFEEMSVNEAVRTMDFALTTYYDHHDLFKKVQADVMKLNHSWKGSAQKYIDLYNSINK